MYRLKNLLPALFVAALCNADDAVPEAPALSRKLQQIIDKIEADDAKYSPFLAEYLGGNKSLERKLLRMKEGRGELVAKLETQVAKEREPLSEEVAKLEKKLDRLSDRYDRAEEGTAEYDKIKAEIGAFEKKFYAAKEKIERLEELLKDRRSFGDDKVAAKDSAKGKAQDDDMVATLPTVPKGRWKGAHLVYRGNGWHGTMDDKGNLTVRIEDPKNPRETLSPAMLFGNPGAIYYIPGEPKHRSRSIVGFSQSPSEPVNQPETYTLQGMMAHYVQFKVDYRFQPDGIWVKGGYQDPATIDYPSTFRIMTNFHELPNVPKDVTQAQIEEMTEGHLITTKEIVGDKTKKLKYPYAKIIEGFAGSIESVKVIGPWQKARVEIKTKRLDAGLHPYIYTRFAPWQGFTFYHQATDNEIRKYRGSYGIFIRPGGR